MILKELSIRGFGKFHDRSITFGDRLNVIYGGNEAGKSTLHAFLRAMFYGMGRARGRAARNDFFSRYEPWGGDGAYGGSLRFEEKGHIYRIERDFSKNPLDLSITDETGRVLLSDPQRFLNQLLGNLSETAYSNTVSIQQLKSATDSGMVNELKNYIANMNTTGNRALNITRASAYLRDQKKAFEQKIVPEAAKNYAENLSEIRKIEETISAPDYKNRMNELSTSRSEGEKQRVSLQNEREALLQKAASELQTLREKHFENREELQQFETAFSNAETAFSLSRKQAQNSGWRIGAALFGLMAAALLFAFWAAENHPELYPPVALPLNALCIAGAAVCALAALSLLRTAVRKKRRAVDDKAQLLSLIREHFDELSPAAADIPDFAALLSSIRDHLVHLSIVCDAREESERQLSALSQRMELLQEQQANTEAGIVSQQKSQWLLEQQLEHLTNLRDESAALKNIIAENDRLREEIEAITLAQETMTRLSTTIHHSFGLYLNERASELISGITGGIYDSLSIDQGLNVFLNTKRKLIPLEQVSAGTIDQVYLALRLAAAELMQKGHSPLPFLFDDSFVNYDEYRLRIVLNWLPEMFPGRQALIFTCHKREAQLLSAAMAEYTLTEL